MDATQATHNSRTRLTFKSTQPIVPAMVGDMLTKLWIAASLAGVAAWMRAVASDAMSERWLWLAIDLASPPVGALRGIWLLLHGL